MKREVLEKILSLPSEKSGSHVLMIASFGVPHWWGKYYINETLVNYRVHEDNKNFGKQYDVEYLYKRQISITKIFKFYCLSKILLKLNLQFTMKII
jgi:hypothetical protein